MVVASCGFGTIAASGGTAHAGGEVEECVAAAEQSQPKRRAGKLIEAKADLVKCVRPICPPVIRADCIRWSNEVETATPSIVLRVVDSAGRDVVEATVTADGSPLTSRLDGRPIPIDPGVHVLRCDLPDHEPASESVVVRETEKNRLVTITLKSKVVIPPPPAPPPPPAADTSGRSPVPWILIGGGGALVASGIVFWAVGSGQRGDLRDGCAKTSSCSQSDVDGARAKLVVGDVLVGLGVLVAAAGVYVAITSSGKASAGIRLAPTTAGATLGLGGGF